MIVYIGNILSGHGKSKSFIELLSARLSSDYKIQVASARRGKLSRLMEMLGIVFRYRKRASVVLIDTYSTSAFWYAFFVAIMCKFFTIPYVPILHGGDLPARYTSSSRVVTFLLKNAATVVSPSQYLLKFFEKNGFQITYIPNFIEIDQYPFAVRQQLRPRLLWVRAFHKIYNPTLAIEVLEWLSKSYPEALLCMIGAFKDSSIEDVRALITHYKLEARVEITGIMRKQDWVAKAKDFDVFINTTNIDNMPISVIEAMALGLPVVSTNVGGIPYLIEDCKTGLLVEAGNPDEMVIAIERLIREEQFASNLIQSARIMIEHFDWHEVKNSWYQILDRYENRIKK